MRKGDLYRVNDKNKGQAMYNNSIQIKEIILNDEKLVDSWIIFDTELKVHNKKYKHKARLWWFLEYCERVTK